MDWDREQQRRQVIEVLRGRLLKAKERQRTYWKAIIALQADDDDEDRLVIDLIEIINRRKRPPAA